MSCNPKCTVIGNYGSDSPLARKQMVANAGNSKFIEGTVHPQCEECWKEFSINYLEDAIEKQGGKQEKNDIDKLWRRLEAVNKKISGT